MYDYNHYHISPEPSSGSVVSSIRNSPELSSSEKSIELCTGMNSPGVSSGRNFPGETAL